jgi:hypothetical protein
MKSAALVRPRRFPAVNWARLLATFLLATTVLGVALDIALWGSLRFRPPHISFIQGASVFVAEMFYAIAYAAMGWVLATRLPRNLLGWIFMILGFAMAAQLTVTFAIEWSGVYQAFRPLDTPLLFGAWVASSFHLPSLVLLTAVVFLRFPTGNLLSTRWAFAGITTLAGALIVGISVGLSPSGLAWYPSLPNLFAAPFAMRSALQVAEAIGLLLMVFGVLVSTLSMIARYRRSADVQRAQMRWIAIAVVVFAGAGLPFVIVRYGMDAPYSAGHILMAAALIAGCFLPVAAAVAILRHRLYDIDLILNRALVYLPLTGILGGLYAAGVALFQRLFVVITGDRSDGAVVITTLVLAGLFTPIKNSLQAFVDRRFKPVAALNTGPSEDVTLTLDQRVALLERRLSRMEVGANSEDSGDW